MKRCIFVAFCLLLFLAALPVNAQEEPDIHWSVEGDTLTIGGTGVYEVDDVWDDSSLPWGSYRYS